ncbi:MAG: MFS transporter, partial [Pseudomonadota bacterium]
FGVWADRADLRRAAIVIQLLQGGLALTLAALILTGALAIWLLAAIALVIGVVNSAFNPVRLALTPRLAPRDALANAIAISSLNFNTARLTGPALGGMSIAAVGAGATTIATVALFIPVVLILAGLRPRPLEGPPAKRTTLLAALTEGARFALAQDAIRSAFALTTVFAFVVRGYLELLAVVADGEFDRGATGLGALMGASGAGALVAAVLLTSRDFVTEARVPRATVVAAFAGFAATALAAASPSWTGALILTAAASFCGTMVGVTMQSVVQLAVDDAHRGRVLSLWIMIGIGGAVIGALIMGWFADIFGIGSTLIAFSVGGAVIAAAIRYRRWRARRGMSA